MYQQYIYLKLKSPKDKSNYIRIAINSRGVFVDRIRNILPISDDEMRKHFFLEVDPQSHRNYYWRIKDILKDEKDNIEDIFSEVLFISSYIYREHPKRFGETPMKIEYKPSKSSLKYFFTEKDFKTMPENSMLIYKESDFVNMHYTVKTLIERTDVALFLIGNEVPKNVKIDIEILNPEDRILNVENLKLMNPLYIMNRNSNYKKHSLPKS